MQNSAQITALSALLAIAFPAFAAANPWNPYPAGPAAGTPRTQVQIAPPQPQSTARSRFAPAGLEQRLTTPPQALYAPDATTGAQVANQQPAPDIAQPTYAPTYAPTPQTNGGYAPQGFQFAQQGTGFNPYAPGYAQAPAYGGYPQGFGGYPQGFGPNQFQGYGGNTPFGPFGIPGGLGGNIPFPGNITNGGVPGFNFSPFGLF